MSDSVQIGPSPPCIRSWAGQLTSLSLSFSVSKVELVIPTGRVTLRIKYKESGSVPVVDRSAFFSSFCPDFLWRNDGPTMSCGLASRVDLRYFALLWPQGRHVT